MTHPPDLLSLDDRDPPLGVPLFRSVILLFGVVPIDYDDVTLTALEHGRRFLERSPTLSQRAWQHERTLDADGEGCRVTDRISFTPKLPGAGLVLAPLLRLVFANRHRNLVKLFGGEAGRVVRD